jgi:hypothetical protein
MFDRFTDRAKKVMSLARRAAIEWQHPFIAAEHILAGLVDEGSGVAANVLKNRGVDLATIRTRVARRTPPGSKPVTDDMLPFTPAGKQLLEGALEVASGLDHNYIGTEHLLLSVLRLEGSPANAVLRELDLEFAALRADVLEFLGATDAAGDEQPEGLHGLLALAALRMRKRVPGLAVVIVPPGDAFDRLYDESIAPALRDAGCTDVRRVEEGLSIAQDMPILAELIVAVLTANDAVAHYIVGLCHGNALRPVLLTDHARDLPTGEPWTPVLEFDLAAAPSVLRGRLTQLARERRSGGGADR